MAASTDIEKVRLLIADQDSVLFSDDEDIQFFLDSADDDLFRAAAIGLRAIAASAALVDTLREALNTKIDRKGVAEQLRASADAYEKQSNEAPAIDFIQRNVSLYSGHDISMNTILESS